METTIQECPSIDKQRLCKRIGTSTFYPSDVLSKHDVNFKRLIQLA